MITSITILAILVGVLVVAVLRSASINYKLIDQIETLKKDHEWFEERMENRMDIYFDSIAEMKKDIENLMDDVADQGIK